MLDIFWVHNQKLRAYPESKAKRATHFLKHSKRTTYFLYQNSKVVAPYQNHLMLFLTERIVAIRLEMKRIAAHALTLFWVNLNIIFCRVVYEKINPNITIFKLLILM